MNKVVLDASALLALIFEEEGKAIIKPLLKSAVMSTVNIAEVLTVLKKCEIDINESLNYIKSMLSEIVDFNVDQSRLVADLYPFTKPIGVSLGDRACIALGKMMQAPIYTADKIWSKLELEGLEIKLIR